MEEVCKECEEIDAVNKEAEELLERITNIEGVSKKELWLLVKALVIDIMSNHYFQKHHSDSPEIHSS